MIHHTVHVLQLPRLKCWVKCKTWTVDWTGLMDWNEGLEFGLTNTPLLHSKPVACSMQCISGPFPVCWAAEMIALQEYIWKTIG